MPETLQLQPSKLGTKEYWDSVYKTEVANFAEFGDEGEVWFGEESVEKMVDWALEHVPSSNNPFVLDVGSGNGALSIAFAEAGYDASRLSGIDYSEDSVRLARSIAESHNVEGLTFGVCDFLNQDPMTLPGMVDGRGWDLITDKGTLDAIALTVKDENGRSPVDGYPDRVEGLLRSGGFFLITSCNFTEEELRSRLDTESSKLRFHSRVPHQTYSFGGKTGTMYATVAFQKE